MSQEQGDGTIRESGNLDEKIRAGVQEEARAFPNRSGGYSGEIQCLRANRRKAELEALS